MNVVDPTEISCQSHLREFSEGAGKLDARRATADDHEVEKPPAFFCVIGSLRLLEGLKDSMPQFGRVVDFLQAWCHPFPIIATKIAMPRTRRDDQGVVGYPPPFKFNHPHRLIHLIDAAE